ncbi:MAG TPA: protein kinase [Pyrinomonadaceae bacterium]|jgi:serine/threonine protein kinase
MLTPNTILQDRYQIIRQLAQGGMGTVYEAIDLRFENQVALKETHFTEEALRKQFEREARFLNMLRHPALARVIDHFTEGDGQFLVMDFIEGDDLSEMQQKRGGAFPVDDVLRWADQLLDALEYLHSHEPPVIHRDIKPQNLKVTGRNQIILLDFGLAKGFAGQTSRVTTSGSIFGYTPNYAPLEQIHGTGTDARSDLYSLAATLYHLLTGTVPPDALSRAMALANEQPDPLRPANEINPEVPLKVVEALQLAMATNIAKRPASAAELRQRLRAASEKQEPSSVELKGTALPPTILAPTEGLQKKGAGLDPTLAASGPPPLYINNPAKIEALPIKWPTRPKFWGVQRADPQYQARVLTLLAKLAKPEVLRPTPQPIKPDRGSTLKYIVIVLVLIAGGVGVAVWLASRAKETVSIKEPVSIPVKITATASSKRDPKGSSTYEPGNVLDQSLATAWVEGVRGPGIGQWIQFDFNREVKLNRIIITPGYFKTPELWKQNNRLASATFHFSDGTSRPFTFPDGMVEQKLEVGGIMTTWVRMEIGNVYRGSVDMEDTPISNIAFDWE